MIEIHTYNSDFLEGMLDVFNAETAVEPHIAHMTPEIFTSLVANKPAFDPEGLFVATSEGRVLGWVHACHAAGTEVWQDLETTMPQIRMLMFSRDQLPIAHALVARATEWLSKSGQTRLLAIHCDAGYPFYRGLWFGGEPICPVTLPHLHLAFEVGGYKATFESIFMVAEMKEEPGIARGSDDLTFAGSPAQLGHPSIRSSWSGLEPQSIAAFIGGEEVGRIGWVMQPHLAAKLGAPAVNIWTLSVNETHRRKGIAAALISRVLHAGYLAGARSASVGTQLWNVPAHMAYAKFGFVPYTITVGRILDLSQR